MKIKTLPLKANFKWMLEKVTGKRIERAIVDALTKGRVNLGELQGLARLTQAVTRDPVKLEPPGDKLEILTSNDIDPSTGKPYPDYLERRAKKKKEGERLPDLNVWPDD